jgi:hypothetical protein
MAIIDNAQNEESQKKRHGNKVLKNPSDAGAGPIFSSLSLIAPNSVLVLGAVPVDRPYIASLV